MMNWKRKLLLGSITILGVTIIVFSLFRLLGDPVQLTVGQSGDKKTMNQIREDLNLDQPAWKQLLFYINDISPVSVYKREEIEKKQLQGFFIGNSLQLGIKFPYLGKSYQTKNTVTSMLAKALPGTLILTFLALLIACIAGIALGILAAYFKDSWVDRASIIISTSGISAPSFFAALSLAYLFGVAYHHVTGLHFSGNWYVIDPQNGERHLAVSNWILPALTLGIRPWAMITQLTRSTMLDIMNQDFIRTAYAKGLNNKTVILKHVMINTMTPLTTAITGWMGELLAGAFFVEYIFGWSGIGKLTIEAIEKIDYPVLMGSILLSTCIFILTHWLSDLLNSKARAMSGK
jgi:peptide/nickel transport system permease protein